jgi:hypothetical protein
MQACRWLNRVKSIIDSMLARPSRYPYQKYCLRPSIAKSQDRGPNCQFQYVRADVISDMLQYTSTMFVPHPCLMCGLFTHDTGSCPEADEQRACIHCRLDGHDLRLCCQMNCYCIVCELPGHKIHHHDGPLNLYECL